MRSAFLCVVALHCLMCGTFVCAEADKSENSVEPPPPSFYGVLQIPPQYFGAPESQSPHHNLQPGSVLLTDGAATTLRVPVARDGTFVVYRIPYGTYLLQAEYHDFTFPTVRVEVQFQQRGQETVHIIRGYLNDFPVKSLDGTGLDEELPIMIPPAGLHSYYVPKPDFSPMTLLKNPMILMMLVSFGLMGIMKLFPEEELKESQKMSRDWQRKVLQKVNDAKNLK